LGEEKVEHKRKKWWRTSPMGTLQLRNSQLRTFCSNLRKRGFCGMDFSRTEEKLTKLVGEKLRKTPKKALDDI